jgi:hypothetical protein
MRAVTHGALQTGRQDFHPAGQVVDPGQQPLNVGSVRTGLPHRVFQPG